MSHGKVLYQGGAEDCIEEYLKLNQKQSESLTFAEDESLPAQFLEINVGTDQQINTSIIEKAPAGGL